MAEANLHQDDDRWEDASDVFDVISEAKITNSEGSELESAELGSRNPSVTVSVANRDADRTPPAATNAPVAGSSIYSDARQGPILLRRPTEARPLSRYGRRRAHPNSRLPSTPPADNCPIRTDRPKQ